MPDWKPALASRLAPLGLSPAREQEIIEELSQHLDDIYEERRNCGASYEDARRGALDELDERDLLTREMQSLRQASTRTLPPPGAPGTANWLADGMQDLAYAARTLAHARGWTAVIVVLLALGIGANTALFSATDALLLSAVPARDPDSLIRLRWAGRNDAVTEHDEYGFNRPAADGREVSASFSYSVFQQLAADVKNTADLFAAVPFAQMSVAIDGQAELAQGFGATGNYFTVLGVTPIHGRLLVPDDDRPAAPPVVVISARYWRSRFGGDPAVIGKIVRANDVPVTIVGITPPEFTGVQRTLGEAPDLTFPLTLDAQLKASTGRGQGSLLALPTAWWLQVMGRLRPNATAAQLQAQLGGVFQRTARADMDGYLKSLSEEDRRAARNRTRHEVPELLVDSGRHGLYNADNNAVAAATILSAVVAVVLLIICANVANLMLSRAIGRRREISVRLSLGATRGRLVRQLLTEAVLLASVGAALGLAVAYWGVRLLPAPASNVSVLRGRTLAFTALAAILTSVVFGALPAFRATKVDVNADLKETARSVSGRRSLLARSLLVVQVALSLALLVAAGLFLQTVNHLRQVDVGFDPRNLLLVRITPRLNGYDVPRTAALYRTLVERFSSLPGVTGAAMSQPALLSGSVSSTDIYVEGQPAPANGRDRRGHEINRIVMSPRFLDVLGVPLVGGRGLTERDDQSSPHVALINEAAARRYFPGQDPLGKRFGQNPEHTTDTEIVGVVRDAKYSSLREPAPPTMYVSYLQNPRAFGYFALRTTPAAASMIGAVRDAVRQVDPGLPIDRISTQADEIERRYAQERLFARAYALFGGVALLLASVGLFGLMSYNVARRTPEMGIRMALGAQRLDVVRLVMRESLLLVGIGVAAGLALALVAGRLVATLLFGLAPRDLTTMAVAVFVMIAVSAIAAYLPARRAARVDPLVALRYE